MQHISGSTLAQVMAWCLMAPRCYLTHCWLIINVVLWNSPESNFRRGAQHINPLNEFWNYITKITATTYRDQWVKSVRKSDKKQLILPCHNSQHDCWWPGNVRGQGISIHGTIPVQCIVMSLNWCSLTYHESQHQGIYCNDIRIKTLMFSLKINAWQFVPQTVFVSNA